VLIPASASPLKYLVQTAKTQAMAGMAAGMVIGAVHGVVAVRRRRLVTGYDVAVEGLTHVGNGVVLGLLGGVAASVAGVTVAAVVGRGIWVVAAPLVASTVVTGSAQDRVERLIRPVSEGFVEALKPVPKSLG